MSEQLTQMQEILKKSLIKIKRLEAELQDSKSQAQNVKPTKEPIAIVGLGCRFPGGIENLDSLWTALIEKKDLSKPIPLDRWDNDAIYDIDPLRPGHTNARSAAFLTSDIRAFDAGFFGIIPREAKSLDPLQRMILEVVYEALEEANIPSASLKGTTTAVYIAIGNSDYIQARLRSGQLETVDVYDATGIPFATAAGRVSYLYDLQGPNFALDAACASSIVGMHLASQALNNDEADTAIVASANLLLTPELFVGLSKLGSLSGSGQCRAFSNDADGYVRGEGCGVVILRKKSFALQNKNHIHAYILGSAVKHDGLSNGFTAPNPQVQLDTIRLAIKDARVQAKDVVFVEAHGIGNKLTDAMEIQAIANGYKDTNHKIYVGSLKPNIGHLEATIGMAMLFKVIGTLKNKQIAPNIYFNIPNEDIPWPRIPIEVPSEVVDINNGNSPIRAAINLSGYSGTNVHMIFESAENELVEKKSSKTKQLLIWSAKCEQSLKDLVKKYLDNWHNISQNNFSDFAYTLQVGRNHFDNKLSIIASNFEEVKNELQLFVSDVKSTSYQFTRESTSSKELAFLFTGQGAQYFGMCKDIYDTESVFKTSIDQCAEILDKILPIPIREIIWGNADENLIHQTFYTQPALFVVEYALARLWLSRGVRPTALLGHSIGEFVALTIAEAISLQDALRLVSIRGYLMQSLPSGEGAMAAVIADEDTVRHYTQQSNGLVDIAAVNAPKAITISGEKNAVAQLVEAMKEVKIKSIALSVSHAFHSYQMNPILEKFEEEVAKIKFKPIQIPVISNVTGKELNFEELTPQYFSKQLRGTVQFVEDVKYLNEELNIHQFIECGPAPTLIGLAGKIISSEESTWIASAKKESPYLDVKVLSLQKIFHSNLKIDWNNLSDEQNKHKIQLPTYAWQRQVYWENPVRNLHQTQLDQKQDTSDEKFAKVESELVKAEAKHVKVTKENLMAIMQLEATETLGLLPGQKIDPNKSLREQGFDSMMSGEYLTKLEKHFDTQLEMSLLHTYGTLNELQRFLVDEFLGGGEIDESNSAVTMNDIVFGVDTVASISVDNWHEIKESDPQWLKIFKKVDKMISTPK
ncbi:MAG: acyltransferase domain-containing protein [Chitinophagales bacterium]|nr:acyltransferase domain-containing protein [Chitinophagales bacterium]